MSEQSIQISGVSKRYRLGTFANGSFRETLYDKVSAAKRFITGGSNGANGKPRDFWALKNVSFDVNRGEVVGIIGGNGAGKSTLLKILSRITDPSDGRASIHGRVGSLLEVGTGFHPELSGRENIFLNGAILGMKRSEIKSKFDQIVAFSEVEKFLDTPVKRYSSGMYVRLAFAVAAHLDPEILIVDEVLAVGDAAFQAKCLGKMHSAAESGRTILFVSHNMGAVDGLCDRCIVLKGGEVVFNGATDEAIKHYLEIAGSHSQNGEYSITDEERREHESSGHILSARVISNGKFSPGGYRVGDPLEFTVRCAATSAIRQPALGIGIDTMVGHRVVTFHTQTSGLHQAVNRGEFTLSCKLDDLVLAPGLYSVKFALEDGAQHLHDIESAFKFEIVAADYYGNSGKQYRGVVLCKQNWTLSA